MKRHTYRHHRQSQTLSDSHKKAIFDSISKKIHQTSLPPQSLLTRRSHYVRPVARISAVMILAVTVFMVAYITDRSESGIPESQQSAPRSPLTTIVQASPLGRVIHTTGSIRIGDQDIFVTSEINEGQILTLDEGSLITFQIDDSIQATINGPARFTLERHDDTTTLLNLIEGTYAEVKTLPESLTSTENVSDTQTATPQSVIDTQPVVRELIVKTPTIQVSAQPQDSIDLVIDESGDQQTIVANAGSDIVVRHLATTESVAITTNQTGIWDFTQNLVAVQEQSNQSAMTDTSAVDTPDQLLAIRYETSQDQIDILQNLESITTPIQDGSESEDVIGVDDAELLALVASSADEDTQSLGVQDETLAMSDSGANVGGIDDDQPELPTGRVLDADRMETITVLLTDGTYSSATSAYDPSIDDTQQIETIQRLVDITNTVLVQFNAAGPNTASSTNLATLVSKLHTLLRDEYFIPPSVVAPVSRLLTVLN